jgi:hypothetical protein
LQEACGKSGGGYFFLPSLLQSAQALQAEYQHQENLAAAQKADKKKLQENNRRYKAKIAQEKCEAAALKKEVKEKEAAEKAAQKERKKQASDAAKAIKSSQAGKRKASSASQPKNKRQKRSGGSAASLPVSEPASAPPPRVMTRGRKAQLPSKFR